VQDDPDQPTKPMGNGSDGLFVSQARHQTAINNLEDASFNLNCGIGRLIENPPHVAIALRRAVALGHASAFFISRACTNPGGELLGGREYRWSFHPLSQWSTVYTLNAA